jgi:hypothetical protein
MRDPSLRRLYVAIGEPGLVCSFDSERLRPVEVVETEPGAHTMCWDADRSSLFVFCPRATARRSTRNELEQIVTDVRG